MSKSDKIRHVKQSLINALEKSMGVVTTACKSVGIHRSTFYEYYNNDPDFKKEVNDIGNLALDFTESKMFEQIRDGNTTINQILSWYKRVRKEGMWKGKKLRDQRERNYLKLKS